MRLLKILALSLLASTPLMASTPIKYSGILVSETQWGSRNPELKISTAYGRFGLDLPRKLRTQLNGLIGKGLHIYALPATTPVVGQKLAVTQIEIPTEQKKVEGKFLTGLVAIGAETTGYGIEVDGGGFFELVIDEQLRQQAPSTKDLRVRIIGVPTTLSGVETRNRPAIIVESIEELSTK